MRFIQQLQDKLENKTVPDELLSPLQELVDAFLEMQKEVEKTKEFAKQLDSFEKIVRAQISFITDCSILLNSNLESDLEIVRTKMKEYVLSVGMKANE